MSYEYTTIGDISKLIISGGTPDTRVESYWNGQFSWLSSGETRNRFIESTEKTITQLGINESSTRLIHKNSIVIASAGQGNTRGQTSFCLIDTYINQSIIGVEIDDSRADPYFVFLNLSSRYQELRQISDSSSIRGSLTTKMIKSLPIILPPLEIQKSISSLIRRFDELISVNLKINDYLAQLGEITFNRWISEITPLKIGSLTDIADFQNGLAMQKYPPSNNGSYPVLKIRELNMGHCDSESNLCSTNIKPEVVVDNEDIVFSWSGSLVLKIWFGGRCGLNQHLFKVTSDNYPKWFYYFWIKYHLNDFIDIAQNKATTMGHINRNHLEEAKVIIPSDSDLSKISETLDPMFRLYCSISRQAVILEELRNVLLNESLIQNK